MKTLYEEIAMEGLEVLKMKGALNVLDQIAQQASAEQWSYTQFLGRLMEKELAQRKQNLTELCLQMANFPYLKSIDGYDFKAQPSVDRKIIEELATGRYLEEGRCLLFLGPPGVGKTHLAIGLASLACSQGKKAYYPNFSHSSNFLKKNPGKNSQISRPTNLPKLNLFSSQLLTWMLKA